MRLATVRAMSLIGSTAMISLLVESADDDPSADVRNLAQGVLNASISRYG
jgi:hypothetical protein